MTSLSARVSFVASGTKWDRWPLTAPRRTTHGGTSPLTTRGRSQPAALSRDGKGVLRIHYRHCHCQRPPRDGGPLTGHTRPAPPGRPPEMAAERGLLEAARLPPRAAPIECSAQSRPPARRRSSLVRPWVSPTGRRGSEGVPNDSAPALSGRATRLQVRRSACPDAWWCGSAPRRRWWPVARQRPEGFCRRPPSHLGFCPWYPRRHVSRCQRGDVLWYCAWSPQPSASYRRRGG